MAEYRQATRAFTDQEAQDVIALRMKGYTQAQIARELHKHRGLVSSILKVHNLNGHGHFFTIRLGLKK
jgi:transcriptional regulator